MGFVGRVSPERRFMSVAIDFTKFDEALEGLKKMSDKINWQSEKQVALAHWLENQRLQLAAPEIPVLTNAKVKCIACGTYDYETSFHDGRCFYCDTGESREGNDYDLEDFDFEDADRE
jgi:hypothetical protein